MSHMLRLIPSAENESQQNVNVFIFHISTNDFKVHSSKFYCSSSRVLWHEKLLTIGSFEIQLFLPKWKNSWKFVCKVFQIFTCTILFEPIQSSRTVISVKEINLIYNVVYLKIRDKTNANVWDLVYDKILFLNAKYLYKIVSYLKCAVYYQYITLMSVVKNIKNNWRCIGYP